MKQRYIHLSGEAQRSPHSTNAAAVQALIKKLTLATTASCLQTYSSGLSI
jgi:hypothetical protein